MLINREKAIAAVRSVPAGTTCRGDAIVQALRALPTVSVTDEMVEVAARAMCWQDTEIDGDCEKACLASSKCLGEGVAHYRSEARTALEAALGATVSDGWQPIETAPRDGRPFIALNKDSEVWVAKYDRHGRINFRSNYWRDSYKYTTRMIDGQEWRLYDTDFGNEHSMWTNHWSLWIKGYEFEPTHWRPLPAQPSE